MLFRVSLCALCVDGGWTVLEPQLEQDIVESVLSLAAEHEWPLHAIPAAACVAQCLAGEAPGFDDLSIRHCLRTHSTAADAPWPEWLAAPDLPTFALDPPAICRFRARALLATSDAWPVEQFHEAWADSLGVVADVADALAGPLRARAPDARLQLPFMLRLGEDGDEALMHAMLASSGLIETLSRKLAAAAARLSRERRSASRQVAHAAADDPPRRLVAIRPPHLDIAAAASPRPIPPGSRYSKSSTSGSAPS